MSFRPWTFCDIVAVDGHTTPDMAMHYQRLSKDRQRALADKVAASITTPQRDVTVSAENDKDKEIARLRARLAELEARGAGKEKARHILPGCDCIGSFTAWSWFRRS